MRIGELIPFIDLIVELHPFYVIFRRGTQFLCHARCVSVFRVGGGGGSQNKLDYLVWSKACMWD